MEVKIDAEQSEEATTGLRRGEEVWFPSHGEGWDECEGDGEEGEPSDGGPAFSKQEEGDENQRKVFDIEGEAQCEPADPGSFIDPSHGGGEGEEHERVGFNVGEFTFDFIEGEEGATYCGIDCKQAVRFTKQAFDQSWLTRMRVKIETAALMVREMSPAVLRGMSASG